MLGSARWAPTESSRTGSDVHVLYLEGRQFWQERNADAINRAVELLQQAVAAELNYVPERQVERLWKDGPEGFLE